MDELKLEVTLIRQKTALRLRAVDNGKETFAGFFETPELDDLIRMLANHRRQMSEPVAMTLDEGARISDVVNHPPIRIGTNSPEGKALFAIRHPGFGWLGFRLRRKAVEVLVQQLRDWLRQQPSP